LDDIWFVYLGSGVNMA